MRPKEWVNEHIRAIRISLVLAMLGLALWGLILGFSYASGHYIVADTTLGRFLGYFLVNLGPELAGIVIGVVVIDALDDWRQDEQLKQQLILQMGSRHNDVTDTAIRTLRARGWLIDGSLNSAYLGRANLKDARLYKADLQQVNLYGANLQRAYLRRANLRGANLIGTNLQKANLREANLQGTKLRGVNLQAANLIGANLHGTNLTGANLQGAIMPDGEEINETIG